nr:MAG TPA: hypothetical protein [Caudoviricetes sp.]
MQGFPRRTPQLISHCPYKLPIIKYCEKSPISLILQPKQR